jgi:hypothetical protein
MKREQGGESGGERGRGIHGVRERRVRCKR